jgi:hypothetical protein
MFALHGAPAKAVLALIEVRMPSARQAVHELTPMLGYLDSELRDVVNGLVP